MRSSDLAELRDYAPRMEERMRRIPTIRTSTPTCRCAPGRRSSTSTATSPRGSACRSTRSGCCSTRPSARRQVSTIYAADDTYQVILEADPRYADTNEVLRAHPDPHAERRAGAARHRGQAQRQADVAHRQPHRPAAVGDHLLQPGAGRRAGRGGARHPGGGRARSACRPPSPPASRAAPRSSSRPSPTRACCCSPPCW